MTMTQRWLSAAQAREYLGGMSERSFYTWRETWGITPIHALPQTIRYDREEIDAAMERAKYAAQPQEMVR